MSYYSLNLDLPGAYRIDHDAIVDLWKIAQKFLGDGELGVRISLQNGPELHDDDIQNLLTDPIVKNTLIKHIEISGDAKGRQDTPRRYIFIGLSSDSWTPVRITITGDRSASTDTRAQIENVIGGQTLRYTLLRKYHRPVFWAAVAVATALLWWLWLQTTAVRLPLDEWKVFVLLMAGVIAALIVLFLGRQMFPQMVFAIGRSAKVGTRAMAWQGFVFTVLGGGLIVSFLERWIF